MSRLQMDPATLARLSRLLDDALEQPPSLREAWIDALDTQLDSLKPQLRDLLSRAAVVETGEFLRTIPKIGDDTSSPSGAMAGEVVGTYRLVRELGVGGMGSVWLAERADGLMQRQVALKLPHLVSPRRVELAERMARERGILASLDHRNIAKLFDAGITEQGQPFLALEYVEGLPIDEYCRASADGSPLPLAARLRLFLQVVQAVAYAHGKLVVHRDLKPANILVSRQGGARLLDFGIAKLLESGETQATRLTQVGGGAFTPDYASPEQILGEALTVASDVYSLGVVLYELLAGVRPYKLKRDSRGALEDAIVQAEPRRPSEVAPPAMRRALRGDLDTIVLKALKKNPGERYATANAFADDIARYLEQRPVLAQADRLGYRVGKFVRRNKLAVASAALVMVAVLGVAGVALWQAKVAIAERSRADTVRSVLTGMLENADPYSNGGKKLTAADLLLQASREFERAPVGDAAVRAEVGHVLATSLFRLNEDETSERLAQRAFEQMVKVLPPQDPQVTRMRILLAEQLRFRSKAVEARAQMNAALPGIDLLRTSMPVDYVYARIIDADVAIEEADEARALELAHAAFDEAGKLLGHDHPLTIRALTTMGFVESTLGRGEQAVATTRDALDRAETAFRDRQNSPALLEARANHAQALSSAGQSAAALLIHEQVLRTEIEIHGPESVEVGIHLSNMAGIQVLAGRIAESVDTASRAMQVRLPQVEPGSIDSLITRNTYARALMAARRPALAAPVLAGMQEDMVKAMGADHPKTLEVRAAYALALAGAGELAQGTTIADEAVSVVRANNSGSVYSPMHARALIARGTGDAKRAFDLEKELLAPDAPKISSLSTAESLENLGAAALMIGDIATADRSFTDAWSRLDQAGYPATPLRADLDLGQAELLLARGQPAQALERAQAADDFWRSFDERNRGAGCSAYWRARAEQALGSHNLARKDFARAASILDASAWPVDRELAKAARANSTANRDRREAATR